MNKILIVLSIVAIMFACKSKQTVPDITSTFPKYQKISLDYGDSLVYFHIAEKSDIKADINKEYTWFRVDTLLTTQGQYSGKLLQGDYEVLSQKNKTLLRKGMFEQGLKVGKWVSWYDNGKIKWVFNYNDGDLTGDFLIQNRAGKPMVKGNFDQGEMNGLISYYQADTIKWKIKYRSGIPTDTIQWKAKKAKIPTDSIR